MAFQCEVCRTYWDLEDLDAEPKSPRGHTHFTNWRLICPRCGDPRLRSIGRISKSYAGP